MLNPPNKQQLGKVEKDFDLFSGMLKKGRKNVQGREQYNFLETKINLRLYPIGPFYQNESKGFDEFRTD